MAEYGPPESNRAEGLALLLFSGGLATWVAALAYASPVLQVFLVVVGVTMDLGAAVVFRQAKVAGDVARAAGE